MTLKLRLLLMGLLFLWKVGLTQGLTVARNTTDLSEVSFLDRTEFKVSYSGNIFWNNGINLGAEYLLKENIISKKFHDQNIGAAF